MFIKLLASLLETLLKGASTIPPQKKSNQKYTLKYTLSMLQLYQICEVQEKYALTIKTEKNKKILCLSFIYLNDT